MSPRLRHPAALATNGLVALVVVAAFSGCSASPDSSDTSGGRLPPSVDDVQVTATTGALRGIVIDEAIRPLAGATIVVTGVEEPRLTAEDGGFVFNGLAAGTYFITASKPGFTPVQASGTVVAGDADPPLVKMLLTLDIVSAPFTQLQEWKAFLQCGAGAPVDNPVSGPHTTINPCFLTGSDNVHSFEYAPGVRPAFAQAEAVWKGTQPLGNRLQFGYYDPASLATNWKTVDGVSPLILPATSEEVVAAVGNDSNDLTVRIFAGTHQPTVVLNQAYDIYMQYFYNFVPREGYTFAGDGPCNPPESCQ